MTKRERKMLASGINPATGQALTNVLSTAARPRIARATAAVPWVAEARAVKAVTVAVDLPDRVWTFDSVGTSGSGRDTIVLSAPMRNGGSFRATFPGDAVRAIVEGRVVGMNRGFSGQLDPVDVETALAGLVEPRAS